MINTGQFTDKRVTVVGLARSGLACANLLARLGARVTVSELQDSAALRRVAASLDPAVAVEFGGHTPRTIKESDLVVVSPGVPRESPVCAWAHEAGVAVCSEIEVAWRLCPAPVIAVTGSCGKTTVTTLIGRVLESSGRRAFVCGNIGTPFCRVVPEVAEGDCVCLEISSFQLEQVHTFKPWIAVMLNFSRNHLDRHRDMQEYLEAKKRIFRCQDARDYLVLNAADPVLAPLASEARSRAVFFREQDGLSANEAAVRAVAGIAGVADACVQEALCGFRGLPHRMEDAGSVAGVRFINDSKATLVESTVWALRSLCGEGILIAGGRDKGVDYSGITAEARGKVRKLLLIGEAAPLIESAVKGALEIERAPTLEEAVARAFRLARAGDWVLLSPMCSSFDMFANYEERGEAFKRAVRGLVETPAHS